MYRRRPGYACSSTSTGWIIRTVSAPGWRPPYGTSACALNARKKLVLVQDDDTLRGDAAGEREIDEGLLADERAAEVRRALSHLPLRWQQLLQMLMADPPATYAEVSDRLGLPVGSIGPTRGRCLEMFGAAGAP